jgi:hypothetical protein
MYQTLVILPIPTFSVSMTTKSHELRAGNTLEAIGNLSGTQVAQQLKGWTNGTT